MSWDKPSKRSDNLLRQEPPMHTLVHISELDVVAVISIREILSGLVNVKSKNNK